MELRHYGTLLRRRWPIWVITSCLAFLLSTLYALLGPQAYEANLRLAVGTEPLAASVGYYDPNYYAWLSSEYLADDLAELLKSEAFAQDVAGAAGRSLNAAHVASVTRTKKTHRMLDVTLTARTFEEANVLGQAFAQTVNTRLPDYFPQLRVQNARVTILNQPVVSRSNPPVLLAAEIALRTLVGMVLGMALAFLAEYLDATIRDREEAERVVGVDVLAEIPVARMGTFQSAGSPGRRHAV